MGPSILIREKFKSAFEQRCFQLMVDAYKQSLIEKNIQLDWEENDIYSQLHQNINLNPKRAKWKIFTNVESHIPKDIPKTKGFSSKFPRIDFRLASFGPISVQYEYFFEAKNLKQNDSALKRRYIDTGINNFVTKKYQNGSVIGYLLEGKIDDTIMGINSLLKKDKRSREVLSLRSNKIFNYCYESYHTDIGILKHLILDFTSTE